MNEVSIGLAFLAGIVSFFSPCVLPVVPAYFSFLVGESVDGCFSRRTLLIRSLLFIAGLSLIFVLLGISASTIGQVIGAYKPLLTKIGGAIVIIFGFQMLGLFRIRWLMMEKRVHLDDHSQKAGGLRAFLLGLCFAAGWTPCIGPVLASILFMAGSTGKAGSAGILLGVYSLGLAIPFLIFAFLAEWAIKWIRKSGKIVQIVQWIGGLILILLGLALLFDQLGRLSGLLPVIPLPY